tara:strand:- start:22888 stop:23448 length:561 start_codon:yes stop_codon:yes gene_type:complete
MEVGDYVVATKYKDGGTRDHFCIGFFNGMLVDKFGKTTDRFMVIDSDGVNFRGNGFRRCEVVSDYVGNRMCEEMSFFKYSENSIWDFVDQYKREEINLNILPMTKENTEHTIKTIEDIFNVVDDENFDQFFADLYLFIKQVGDVKKNHPKTKVTAMLWTDDGINEITGVAGKNIRINFKKNEINRG